MNEIITDIKALQAETLLNLQNSKANNTVRAYKSDFNDFSLFCAKNGFKSLPSEPKIVSIAHYRTMPRPIKGEYIGFLDDLYVEPDFRGQKIAQKLISHLKSLSKGNNWNGIRWITHSSNENAKKLYDKIANNTGFELYELKGN